EPRVGRRGRPGLRARLRRAAPPACAAERTRLGAGRDAVRHGEGPVGGVRGRRGGGSSSAGGTRWPAGRRVRGVRLPHGNAVGGSARASAACQRGAARRRAHAVQEEGEARPQPERADGRLLQGGRGEESGAGPRAKELRHRGATTQSRRAAAAASGFYRAAQGV
ncbi:hypothetical protein BN1708_018544, partial [Verticillium longisporum]